MRIRAQFQQPISRIEAIVEVQTQAFLTGRDNELTGQFDRLLQLIRDRTNSVVFKHATGVYITGRSGTGKTHAVTSELAAASTLWFAHNARLTPMGLFELVYEHPNHIIVLDDVPSI